METLVIDGVEVKATFAEDTVQAALAAYGLDVAHAKRQVVDFFDVLDPCEGTLRLLSAGVVLRLRRDSDGSGSATLKLRPADPVRIAGFAPADEDDYKVEVDWSRSQVLAASLDTDVEADLAAAVVAGDEDVRALFSAGQLRLLAQGSDVSADDLVGLHVAGPITAYRWKDAGGQDGLRAEQWTYAGGRTFLELSRGADDLTEAETLREALLADVAARGLVIEASATSKTETVLRDLLAG